MAEELENNEQPNIDELVKQRVEEELKKQKPNIYRGGLNEATTRLTNSAFGILRENGFEVGDDTDFEEALRNALKAAKPDPNKAKETEEEISAKIQAAHHGKTQAEKERDQIRNEFNDYKISMEVMSAIGSQAVNQRAAMRLLMDEYRFELKKDGGISIKDKSGVIVKDDMYNPASMEWVVQEFLNKNPYLVKAENRKTENSGDLDKVTGDWTKKDSSQWTPAERKTAHKLFSEGKAVMKNGRLELVQ